MKKIVLIFSSLLMSLISTAQGLSDSSAKGFWDDPFNDPLFPIYFVAFFVFVVIILTITVAFLMLQVLRMFIDAAAQERATKLGIPYVVPQSWWSKFWQEANAMVPIEKEKDIELDHNYDGIHELDNHLPPWWKGLFYGSMVFAVIYMVMYHFSDTLPLSRQEYENELSYAAEEARIFKASQPVTLIDESTLTFTNDAAMIAKGKVVFMSSNCGSCHRNDGGGNMIGPNLSDEYWLHGGDVKNVFATINKGVVEKAMPAWGKTMSQKDVLNVAYYVMSLQGSNPPNPKASQGELYKPKPSASPTDSTKVSMN